MKWEIRRKLKDKPIEVQEHYFNLYYQISIDSANNYISIHNLSGCFFTLAIGVQMINLMRKGLKEAKLI